MSRPFYRYLPVVLLFPLLNCGSSSQHTPEEKYYLVGTNVKVPYWQQAFAGLNHAGNELKVKVELIGADTYDTKAEVEQFRDVVRRKPTGILVSAADPKTMQPEIDAAIGQGIPVIAIDSDAPQSKRLYFIGTDNYKAGVMGAKVAVERLKGKGNVVVFTNPEQINAQERLHGYKDIFDSHPGIKITEIVDIKGDPRQAFDRTTEIVEKKAPVDAFVCLVSVACPEVAEVLGRNNVTDKIVVAMDTNDRTLDAVRKGLISATVGQKPYTMAYLGLKALDDLHHDPLKSLTGNFAQDPSSPLPLFVDTGATLIDKSNVDQFAQTSNSAGSK